MTRYPRQDPIDGWHHAMNHAVAAEDLFICDKDRYEFIRRLREAEARFGVAVVAFCLMGNHFHLILYCPNRGLSAFMHYLQSIYAREFNVRHGRTGRLYQSEFRCKPIASEGQAITAVRYVHRNPLELGIDIRTYPWSSYLAYVRGDATFGSPDDEIATNLLGGPRSHQTYVETDQPSDKTRMTDGKRTVLRSAPPTVERGLIALCEIASSLFAVKVQEIVAPRAGARNDARSAVTFVAYESRTGFADELRSLLGYRTAVAMRTSVSRTRKRLSDDPVLRGLIAELRTQWASTDEALAS